MLGQVRGGYWRRKDILDSGVDRQGRTLNERFAAATVAACEGASQSARTLWGTDSPLIRVDTEVTREVALASERPVAVVEITNKRAHHEIVAWADLVVVVDKL